MYLRRLSFQPHFKKDTQREQMKRNAKGRRREWNGEITVLGIFSHTAIRYNASDDASKLAILFKNKMSLL